MQLESRSLFIVLAAGCLLSAPCPAGAPPVRVVGEDLDSAMYTTPNLTPPRVILTFPEQAKALWLRALDRPEMDLRCKAADAITLAQRRGVKGLETTISALTTAFNRPEEPPPVILAVAQALIALDARATAPSLAQRAQAGSFELRNLVEPALARWDYQPARAVWLERLRDPATPPRTLALAIQCLAAVGEKQATERLREIMLSERVSGPGRVEAARALGTIGGTGLEKDAERLAADTPVRGMVGRLTAATLLNQALTHREMQSGAGIQVLQRLAVDPEPAVAAVALARVLDIDPELLVPTVDRLLASPDPNVRSYGVEVLFRRPSEKHIRLLGGQLDDLHPDVRVKARKSLQALAGKDEFKNLVIAEGTRGLASHQWRGLEQAVILLTTLDHKPATERFLELLQFERPEVFITAGWGLRKLAVAETLPKVRSYVKEELERIRHGARLPHRPDVPPEVIDHQVSQLLQFLGQQRYAPAESLLREFVPHVQPLFPCPESRAAAVWGLGMILEGKTDDNLAEELEVRLKDTTSIPPENVQVRRMAALTIGRLKAEGPLPRLRLYCAEQKPNDDAVHNACGWAIERITGEPMLWSLTIEKVQRDWFLSPND